MTNNNTDKKDEQVNPPPTKKIKTTKTKKKKKKPRCFNCKKKLGILSFDCKCTDKGKFCSKCNHASSHNCTYDHAADHRKYLEKQLVKAVADKMEDRF